MVLKSACKAFGVVVLLTALAGLAAGCMSISEVKGTYTSDQDARAVQEMEWNLDPYM